MPKTVVLVGPRDNGRRMALEDFDRAEAQPGYLYELDRGRVIVSDIPGPRHFAQLDALREMFSAYRRENPKRIRRIGGGAECKVLVRELEVERHPDLAIYKTLPPPDAENLWAVWVPEIVVEIVSPSSEQRDYHEKPEEYLRFGVREYWVIDADRRELRVFRRSGDCWVEKVVRPPAVYRTRLLPGFVLDIAAIFAAADAAEES